MSLQTSPITRHLDHILDWVWPISLSLVPAPTPLPYSLCPFPSHTEPNTQLSDPAGGMLPQLGPSASMQTTSSAVHEQLLQGERQFAE